MVIATSLPWYHLGIGTGGYGCVVWEIGQSYNCPFNRWDNPVSFIVTMEKDIRVVLNNDGYYDKNVNQSFPMADLPNKVLWGDENESLPFKIVSIDRTKKKITTVLNFKEASGEYIFIFDELIRFLWRVASNENEKFRIADDNILKKGHGYISRFRDR